MYKALGRFTSRKRKRKEKTTPFGVNLTRSLVIYQAAQQVYLNRLTCATDTTCSQNVSFLSAEQVTANSHAAIVPMFCLKVRHQLNFSTGECLNFILCLPVWGAEPDVSHQTSTKCLAVVSLGQIENLLKKTEVMFPGIQDYIVYKVYPGQS